MFSLVDIIKIIRVMKLIKFHSSSKDHILLFFRVTKQFFLDRPIYEVLELFI